MTRKPLKLGGKKLKNFATDIARRSKGIFGSTPRGGGSMKRGDGFSELTDATSCPYQEFDDEDVYYSSVSESERNHHDGTSPHNSVARNENTGFLSTDSSSTTEEFPANRQTAPTAVQVPATTVAPLESPFPNTDESEPVRQLDRDVYEDDRDDGFGDDFVHRSAPDAVENSEREDDTSAEEMDNMRQAPSPPIDNTVTKNGEEIFPDVRQRIDVFNMTSKFERPRLLSSGDESFVPQVPDEPYVREVVDDDKSSNSPPRAHYGSSDFESSDQSTDDDGATANEARNEPASDDKPTKPVVASGLVRRRVRNFAGVHDDIFNVTGEAGTGKTSPNGGLTRNRITGMLGQRVTG